MSELSDAVSALKKWHFKRWEPSGNVTPINGVYLLPHYTLGETEITLDEEAGTATIHVPLDYIPVLAQLLGGGGTVGEAEAE